MRLSLLIPNLKGVVRLWSGDIDSARGSLQLLLLVDYICDWGRDKFRESTIRSLAAFSQSNRQGTVTSDIFSLRAGSTSPAPRSNTMGNMTADTRKAPQEATGRKRFNGLVRHLDPEEEKDITSLTLLPGAVRDIRQITSRTSGVLITEENLEMLQKSSSSEKAFSMFATDLALLVVRWGFETTWNELYHAQRVWHDKKNLINHIHLGDTKFIATMSCASYISAHWKLMRELYWFAIEESALPLLKAALVRASPSQESPLASHLSEATFVVRDVYKVLRLYTETSARLNMTACLMRPYVVLEPHPVHNSFQIKRLEPSTENIAHPTRGDFHSVSDYGPHPGAVVTQIHSDYKTGSTRSCPTLLHNQSHDHFVRAFDSHWDWQRGELEVLWKCQLGHLETPLLSFENPILVVDPQEKVPDTGPSAHCTFATEIPPLRYHRQRFRGTHKMYFIAERVLHDRRQSWIGPKGPGDVIEQLVKTPKSGDAWLVQVARWPAKKSIMDEEEQIEGAPPRDQLRRLRLGRPLRRFPDFHEPPRRATPLRRGRGPRLWRRLPITSVIGTNR